MADGLYFPKIGLISWKLLFTTKKKDISESVFYIKSLNDVPLFSHSTQTANTDMTRRRMCVPICIYKISWWSPAPLQDTHSGFLSIYTLPGALLASLHLTRLENTSLLSTAHGGALLPRKLCAGTPSASLLFKSLGLFHLSFSSGLSWWHTVCLLGK